MNSNCNHEFEIWQKGLRPRNGYWCFLNDRDINGNLIDPIDSSVLIPDRNHKLFGNTIYSNKSFKKLLFNMWKDGYQSYKGVWPFSNNPLNGYIIDPISLEPLHGDNKMSSFLIGNTIYSGNSLKKIFQDFPEYDNLPGECDVEEFINQFSGKIQDPMTREFINDEDLTEIFKIFTGMKYGTQTFLHTPNTRMKCKGGTKRRRSTKKRTPTKKRKLTKRRKYRKIRR